MFHTSKPSNEETIKRGKKRSGCICFGYHASPHRKSRTTMIANRQSMWSAADLLHQLVYTVYCPVMQAFSWEERQNKHSSCLCRWRHAVFEREEMSSLFERMPELLKLSTPSFTMQQEEKHEKSSRWAVLTSRSLFFFCVLICWPNLLEYHRGSIALESKLRMSTGLITMRAASREICALE